MSDRRGLVSGANGLRGTDLTGADRSNVKFNGAKLDDATGQRLEGGAELAEMPT